MAKFRFIDIATNEILEETVMSDCHTIEDALNTRYGSAVPEGGVDVELIEGDDEHGEASGSEGDGAEADSTSQAVGSGG